jgi:hypothetical protein
MVGMSRSDVRRRAPSAQVSLAGSMFLRAAAAGCGTAMTCDPFLGEGAPSPSAV